MRRTAVLTDQQREQILQREDKISMTMFLLELGFL